MRQLVLIGVSLACLATAASAHALTTDQVRAEARDELPTLTFELIAFQSGETTDEMRDEYRVEGAVYACRRTSRRRGSCVAEVVDEETGAGCNAYVVVREGRRIRDGMVTRIRDVECWP